MSLPSSLQLGHSRMPVAPVHYNWHARAVTVPGPDTDLAIHVCFDSERYLFGCGEGTQRALTQQKLSSKGLTAIFVGSGGSAGRGGLPGMIMTATDIGIEKLDIVGPPDITHYLATLRSAVVRNTLTLNTCPHSSSQSSPAHHIYKSSTLTIQSIALRPHSEPSASSEIIGNARDKGQQLAETLVGDMFQNAGPSIRPNPYRLLPIPRPEDTLTNMVYICQAPSVKGKFDAIKAKELGVPNGGIRGELVRGNTIEFEDRARPGVMKKVKPEEVVGADTPGAYVIFVDCTEATLPALLASTELQAFHVQQDQDQDTNNAKVQSVKAALMVHRVPTSVWQNTAYKKWMRAFGPNTQHLIGDTANSRNDIVFTSSAWNCLRLSLIDDEIFPIPHFSTPNLPDTSSLPSNASLIEPYHTKKLYPSGPLIFRPREKNIVFPTTAGGVHAAKRDLLKRNPEFAAECSKAKQAVRADPRWGQPSTMVGDDIVVTTIGTGSAIPSKYRNVSCTHLDIPNVGGVLLDTGEGTLGQLRRRFGQEGMQKVYEDLRMIFISHMHADHHLGLQAVLEDRFKHGIASRLYLVGPPPIAHSLSESGPWVLGVPQNAVDNVIFIDNNHLQSALLPGLGLDRSPTSAEVNVYEEGVSIGIDDIPISQQYADGLRRWPVCDIFTQLAFSHAHSKHYAAELLRDLGLAGLRTPRMQHRGTAWGLVMQHQSGWKVAYSGDTTPCAALIQAGRGATLLVHEATLEDDKIDMAFEKGHSTFSQAIDIGMRMKARHILLNHFSQRYPKLPKSRQRIEDQGDGSGPVVSISFDFMSARIGDLWRMKYYMDAVEMLYAEEEEDGDDTTKPVEQDVNSTVGENDQGQGKGDKGKGCKAVKRVEETKGGNAVRESSISMKILHHNAAVNHQNRADMAKRQVSPSGIISEAKKVKSDEGERQVEVVCEKTV